MPTEQPNTAQIRQALNRVFDDARLSAFCFDYFEEVYDLFGQGMRKDEKITLLLGHCRRQPTGFESLLQALHHEYELSNHRRQELKPVIDVLEAYIDSQRRVGTTSDRAETSFGDAPGSPSPHQKPAEPQRIRMGGLSSALRAQLRQTLLDCGPFASNDDLRYVFVDQRIEPWADGLPQVHNKVSRVDAVIAYLLKEVRVDTGENLLVLFVEVLRDSTHPQKGCYRRLSDLATALGAVSSTQESL